MTCLFIEHDDVDLEVDSQRIDDFDDDVLINNDLLLVYFLHIIRIVRLISAISLKF
jgi:hypothetical protein